MIPISSEMVFASVAFAALAGVACGVLYSLFRLLFAMIMKLLNRWLKKQFSDKENCGILRNLFDCLFVLFVGLTYILSCYVFLDGVFSIYSLLTLVASFLLSNKTFCLILNSNSST